MTPSEPSISVALWDWITNTPGAIFASIMAAFVINKSRKRDAAKDRDQRGKIADRQAKIAERAADDAAADRKVQLAQLNVLAELLRRTEPESPPGAQEEKQTDQRKPQPQAGGELSQGKKKPNGEDSPAVTVPPVHPDGMPAPHPGNGPPAPDVGRRPRS